MRTRYNLDYTRQKMLTFARIGTAATSRTA